LRLVFLSTQSSKVVSKLLQSRILVLLVAPEVAKTGKFNLMMMKISGM
jgi:hypothetical protein